MASAHKRLTTVVSTKGQVILPKVIREQRRWPAGTRLVIESTPDGILLKPASVFPSSDIDAVFGSLAWKGPALSIEDMNAAVAGEAKRRARD